MKKNNPKYKYWLKKRNLKKAFRKARFRKIKILKNRKSQYSKKQGSTKSKQFTVLAPEVFSIINNGEETVKMFNNIITFIEKSKSTTKNIFIDFKNVIQITNDAIMYLLAILKNIRVKYCKLVHFSGNEPINEESRKIFRESGFLEYVKSNRKEFDSNNNKFKIQTGNKNEPTIVKEICDFTSHALDINKKELKHLYDTISELMTNTFEHAYHTKLKIDWLKNWYVFAENFGDRVKYIFLDTGSGIPSTIYRSFGEKIKEALIPNESELVMSVLNGKFRTRTKEKFRGKGIPKIYSYYNQNKLQSLKLLSNKARCLLEKNKNNIYNSSSDSSNKLYGTVYYWEIRKEV